MRKTGFDENQICGYNPHYQESTQKQSSPRALHEVAEDIGRLTQYRKTTGKTKDTGTGRSYVHTFIIPSQPCGHRGDSRAEVGKVSRASSFHLRNLRTPCGCQEPDREPRLLVRTTQQSAEQQPDSFTSYLPRFTFSREVLLIHIDDRWAYRLRRCSGQALGYDDLRLRSTPTMDIFPRFARSAAPPSTFRYVDFHQGQRPASTGRI